MSLDTQLQSAFTAVGNAVKGKVSTSQLGVANGVATLGSDGKVPSTQLPSFVDDVLEFSNLAAFPGTGSAGIIYVALDTNVTYRWGGSSYVKITSGEVVSVNGMTGAVTISTITGNAGTATKLASAVTIGGVSFDGSAAINLPGVNTTGNQNTTGSAASLSTSRNINGVAFNGTASIEIESRLGTAIASAATITIGTAGLGETIHVTGTTTISSFGTAASAGISRTLVFDGAVTITHNGTSLICPGGVNIVAVAGTVIEVLAESTSKWRVTSVTHPNISFTELGYLDGVTSSIQTQFSGKADLASPIFTGTPTLPTGTIATTQTAGDSSTKLATTAFVTNAVSTVTTNIGATNTDYVAVFNAALG